MKAITLMLEEDEILILRGQVRMIKIMIPDTNEQLESYAKKILDATSEASDDTKREIAKMQRAMRRIKETPQYEEFISAYKVLEKLLVQEMSKEENDTGYEQ